MSHLLVPLPFKALFLPMQKENSHRAKTVLPPPPLFVPQVNPTVPSFRPFHPRSPCMKRTAGSNDGNGRADDGPPGMGKKSEEQGNSRWFPQSFGEPPGDQTCFEVAPRQIDFFRDGFFSRERDLGGRPGVAEVLLLGVGR